MGHLEVGTGCCHLGPGERGVLSKGWVGIVSWVLLRMDKITAADMDQCKKKRGLGRRSQTPPPLRCGLGGELAWRVNLPTERC
jgi:hypothetical protein